MRRRGWCARPWSRSIAKACLSRSSRAKADQARSEVRTVAKPVRGAAVAREQHPASTPQHARRTLLRPTRIERRRVRVVFSVIVIRDPIPRVAPLVVQPVRVVLICANRGGAALAFEIGDPGRALVAPRKELALQSC